MLDKELSGNAGVKQVIVVIVQCESQSSCHIKTVNLFQDISSFQFTRRPPIVIITVITLLKSIFSPSYQLVNPDCLQLSYWRELACSHVV